MLVWRVMDLETRKSNQHRNKEWHPVLEKLFAIKCKEQKDVSDLLSWNLHDLPDLTILKDLDCASSRIIEAILSGQTIGIYGDYDVDGTTATALLYYFFRLFDIIPQIVVSSRFKDGHGLHQSSIDEAHAKGVDLLITVDCGISAHRAAEYALQKKIDLIITDHHSDGGDTLPQALAVVDPKRSDEDHSMPHYHLAGVGVAFALALKVKQDWEKRGEQVGSIYPLLPLVAIGTLCDLVQLNSMNLKLVRHGLKEIKERKYHWLIPSFGQIDFRRIQVLSEKISYDFGPKINSQGRLADDNTAINLLTADTKDQAYSYYQRLVELNDKRKSIQEDVFMQAKQQIGEKFDGNLIIVYHPTWHEGVSGIVAAKLVENYKVPAIVFTRSSKESILKGSARTIGELNIYQLLSECSQYFEKYGGHKGAAGLSIKQQNFFAFKECIEKEIIKYREQIFQKQKKYDLEIDFEQVDTRLLEGLDQLAPFGMGNEMPHFLMRNVLLESYQIIKDKHVRWQFRSLSGLKKGLFGISFNYLDKLGVLSPEEIQKGQNSDGISVIFTLRSNFWNGNEFLQLMVEQVALSYH